MIVRGTNIGVMVDVLGPHEFFSGAWRVRVHADAIGDICPVKKGEVTGCLDSKLRPIRDHGDDARDETLEWKQVLSREGQPA